eukprot:CAMPEP_0196186960 /NCGR_PEP_ID=MMETSP0911-20130528/39432_1 /TAXON_ID=49265 /ORGANISM="Thalassiosira rotula, Strain GSO102" /LENGTH=66 /DNA_ID=CAMNT_0041457901 /DNA_START=10 /DNA_END=207 /DNA_ORIENTATION=-
MRLHLMPNANCTLASIGHREWFADFPNPPPNATHHIPTNFDDRSHNNFCSSTFCASADGACFANWN